MTEEWRGIPGWPGYEASSTGRVRSSNGIKVPFRDPKGYLKVKLWSHSRAKNLRVSGLVALAFHGPAPAGHVVRHRNGANDDNRADNLLYGTRSENEQDKVRHGTALLGERHHQAKLCTADVQAIRARYQRGSREDGSNAIAKDFGVTGALIRYIVRGETWRHV
ncbi:NUMOD4 motif-containing HNH endonuclease [Acidovorax sp. SDU_ACID1]|uniref:NUMOD4 motif-containing HNH endonuclease n=1 Tax=Acidovorax sp. SDU_ACID1 TaxID=3136632 RepID=UPI003873C58E